MERQGMDSTALAFLLQQAVSCSDIPQPPGAIEGCSAKVAAPGMESFPSQPSSMACPHRESLSSLALLCETCSRGIGEVSLQLNSSMCICPGSAGGFHTGSRNYACCGHEQSRLTFLAFWLRLHLRSNKSLSVSFRMQSKFPKARLGTDL